MANASIERKEVGEREWSGNDCERLGFCCSCIIRHIPNRTQQATRILIIIR